MHYCATCLQAKNDLAARMQTGVFGPLEQWVKTYNDALVSVSVHDVARVACNCLSCRSKPLCPAWQKSQCAV